jgi:5'-3' exonuclease
MGYKMKGSPMQRNFGIGKSPAKITSTGVAGMVDAWRQAAVSGAEKEIQKSKNMSKGIDSLAGTAQDYVKGVKGVGEPSEEEQLAKDTVSGKVSSEDSVDQTMKRTEAEIKAEKERKAKAKAKADKLAEKGKRKTGSAKHRLAKKEQNIRDTEIDRLSEFDTPLPPVFKGKGLMSYTPDFKPSKFN